MNNSNVQETTNTTVLDEKNVNGKSTTTTSTSTETSKSVSTENATSNNTETKVELNLTHLDKDFVYELMSIPTVSSSEYRLVTYIILWARRNGVKYEFDDYGNVYLTKGEVGANEYYPCVTAHLDSVQTKHKLYAQAGQELEVKTRIVSKKHEIYVDGMGIGGDDKAGVLIGLTMFSHVDKLKACFFLEEETGCRGSNQLNTEWFKDVGYVLGYDSPDLNRAAWACSGTKLFDADFFKTHMQEICKKHGLTDFRSEPFTDVKVIREKTNIICMNFGSGYYNGHMPNEYCVIEDMDTACRMGHELIQHLGSKRYMLEHKTSSGWTKQDNGTWVKTESDTDEAFFNSLSPRKATYYGYQYSGSGSSYTSGSTTNKSTTTNTTTSTATNKKDDSVDAESVKYIVEKYDLYVESIKTGIKEKCKELNIDFAQFEDIFKNEIKF